MEKLISHTQVLFYVTNNANVLEFYSFQKIKVYVQDLGKTKS